MRLKIQLLAYMFGFSKCSVYIVLFSSLILIQALYIEYDLNKQQDFLDTIPDIRNAVGTRHGRHLIQTESYGRSSGCRCHLMSS